MSFIIFFKEVHDQEKKRNKTNKWYGGCHLQVFLEKLGIINI